MRNERPDLVRLVWLGDDDLFGFTLLPKDGDKFAKQKLTRSGGLGKRTVKSCETFECVPALIFGLVPFSESSLDSASFSSADAEYDATPSLLKISSDAIRCLAAGRG